MTEEIKSLTPKAQCPNCGDACAHGRPHGRGCEEGCISGVCPLPTNEGKNFAEDLLHRITVVVGYHHPAADASQMPMMRDQIARLFDAHALQFKKQAN